MGGEDVNNESHRVFDRMLGAVTEQRPKKLSALASWFRTVRAKLHVHRWSVTRTSPKSHGCFYWSVITFTCPCGEQQKEFRTAFARGAGALCYAGDHEVKDVAPWDPQDWKRITTRGREGATG